MVVEKRRRHDVSTAKTRGSRSKGVVSTRWPETAGWPTTLQISDSVKPLPACKGKKKARYDASRIGR